MFAKLTSTKLATTKLATTKLATTKLASIRVLRQAHFGLEPMLRAAPAHANDNRVTPHSRTTERPVLSCRWVSSAGGGLECRWFLADGEATRPNEAGSAVRRMQRPVAVGGRPVALVRD